MTDGPNSEKGLSVIRKCRERDVRLLLSHKLKTGVGYSIKLTGIARWAGSYIATVGARPAGDVPNPRIKKESGLFSRPLFLSRSCPTYNNSLM